MLPRSVLFASILALFLPQIAGAAETPTFTPTPSITPYVTPTPSLTPVNIIQNYNFSSPNQNGFEYWVPGRGQTYAPLPITVSALAYNPPVAAYDPPAAQIGDTMDSFASMNDDSWLYQQVTIPRNALYTELVFYCNFYNETFFIGDISSQYQEAVIQNSGGAPLRELFRVNTQCAISTEWWEYRFDMNDYIGQTIRLYFHVLDDGYLDALTMYLDDVSLWCGPTATWTYTPTFTCTSTVTPTYTITKTATPSLTITMTATVSPTPTISPTQTPWAVEGGKVVVGPNPAKGDTITFMYSLGEITDITIEIYNLRGFKIAHLQDRDQPAMINRKTLWDIRNVAPGVYLYKVVFRSKSGSSKTTPFERIVITH